jgi:putative aldouronate transport system permease protein
MVIAFKDYNLYEGIAGSPWVGFKHFIRLFSSRDFFRVVRNTFLLNLYSLAAGFPVPIILALMLNEVRSIRLKKTIQLTIYLPHFVSWVIMGGIITSILSPSTGIVNTIIRGISGKEIFFLGSEAWWPIVFVVSGIWKEAGWGTIIYLAAISTINPEMYESAIIDGASKIQQILYITIPGITMTISILLILRLGNMLEIGFEQVFMLQNLAVMDVSDVISTYIYRQGIQGFRYSYTTALGIFKSIIGFLLIWTANKVTNKISGTGIW